MHRYWLTWDRSSPVEPPIGAGHGCGVTGFDLDDALRLVKDRFGSATPPISSVVEDVDVSTLDAGHVLPNMGVVIYRGVWFPAG